MDVPDPQRLDPEHCRKIRQILSHVGDKWSVLVIMILRANPQRFSALKRSIDGISQRMLTLTLRHLERDGLVARTVTPSIPPRVDYALTAMGHSLAVPVQTLGLWAMEHLDAVDAAHSRYDDGAAPENHGDPGEAA